MENSPLKSQKNNIEGDEVDIKQKSLFARLKKLFSSGVVVRNIGGKKLKVKDTGDLMYATDRNSLRDRFNRVRSTSYNAYTRDFSLAYQAARIDLFRDYDTMDMDPILSSALDVYSDECVSGETIIPLLNGEKKTIESLYKESYKNFWVYSCDENGNFKPELCEKVAHNGKKEMYEITLDDNTVIKATGNHTWITSDNILINTDQLIHGTSLKIFQSKLSHSKFLNGYEMLLQGKKWEYTHRLVARNVDFLVKEKENLLSDSKVIHHKSHNKLNNDPTELQWMDWKEHKLHHARYNKELWSDPIKSLDWKEKSREFHRKYWTKEKREVVSNRQKRFMENWVSGLTEKERSEIFGCEGEKNGMFGKGYKLKGEKNGRYKGLVDKIENVDLESYENDVISGMSSKVLTEKYKIRTKLRNEINKKLCEKYNVYRVYQIKNIKNYLYIPIETIKNEAIIGIDKGYNILRDLSYLSNLFNTTNYDLFTYIRSKGYKGIKDLLNSTNHRVVSIKKLGGMYDAYDLVNVGNDSHLYAIETKDGSKLLTHNCLTVNELGKMLVVDAENDNIKGILNNLFYDVLNIEHNLWSWVRNMTKYGDFYLRLYISPQYGVYQIEPISAYNVERLENTDPLNKNYVKFQIRPTDTSQVETLESFECAHFRLLSDSNFLPYGKCLTLDTHIDTEFGSKYIKDLNIGENIWTFNIKTGEMELSKVKNKICSGEKEILKIITQHNFIKASKNHPILVFDKTTKEFIYKASEDIKIGDLLIIKSKLKTEISEDKTRKSDISQVDNFINNPNIILDPVRNIENGGEEETWDIQIDSENSNFIANGIVVHNSMIEGARRVWKQLSLLEDAMLIHRIMRAPEKRVFKLDVGSIPPNEIDNFMEKSINKMKKVPYVDPQTGDYNLKFNLQNMVEDFWLPVRGSDSGTSIETLSGMEFTGIDDVEYLRNKLMAALKIPKAFIGYDAETSGKATLASEDVRFARTIQRIQKVIVSELEKIAIVHLYAQGYRDENLVNFKLELTNPSTIFEKEKIEIWSEKTELARNMIENKIFPLEWIYKNVFKLSKDDSEELSNQIVDDSKQKWRLKSIEEEGNDPAKGFEKINPNDEKGGMMGGPDMGGGGMPLDLGGPPIGGDEGGGNNIPPVVGGGNGPLQEEMIVEDEESVEEGHGEHSKDYVEPSQKGRKDSSKYPFGEDPLGNLSNKQKPRKKEIKDKSSSLTLEKKERFNTLKKDMFIKSLSDYLIVKKNSEKKELIKESDNKKSLLDESNIIDE